MILNDRKIELRPTQNGNYNLKVRLLNKQLDESFTDLIIIISGFNDETQTNPIGSLPGKVSFRKRRHRVSRKRKRKR